MKNKYLIPSLLLASGLLLAACDSSVTSSGNAGQSGVAGRMQGDNTSAKIAASTIDGVVVTAFAINSDGSQGTLIAKDTTDALGNFQINSSLTGTQNWMIVATQGTMQWMTRFNGTLSSASMDTTRPINLESTLLTQVYLNLQKTTSGKAVTSGEITAAIDANVATSLSSQYESDDSTSRVILISHLSNEIVNQSQARTTYMTNAYALYTTDVTTASTTVQQAEANLNVALYKANGSVAQAKVAETAYLQAMIAAFGKSDSVSMSYARANEAAYHATLTTATAAYTADSSLNSLRRRALHITAVAVDTAMQREFKRANASSAQLTALMTAGTTFKTLVDTSRTEVSRDSLASHYRAAVRALFLSQGATADSAFISIKALADTGALATFLHTYATSLQTALAADMSSTVGTTNAFGTDLLSYNTQAQTQILTKWQTNVHNSGNADHNSAMAQIMAYYSVSSNSSHNGQ